LSKIYTVEVQQCAEDLVIELPEEVVKAAGFRVGDEILWTPKGKGFVLTKKE